MTWFLRNWDQVAVALGQHVTIVLTALVIAFAIALPVGIIAARNARVYAIAITVAGFLYTIPTLAFLALLIPLVGLGRTNAIIAMVAFSLVVLIRNIATGIRQVPPDIVDAARGMGMTPSQILRQIETPLAIPVVFAGLRTAAVQVVSGAVLAAFIGGGGLGDFITAGIAMMAMPQLLVGAIPVTLLSLSTDYLFGTLERRLTPRGIR